MTWFYINLAVILLLIPTQMRWHGLNRTDKQRRLTYIILSMGYLAFLSATRNMEVGTDTATYCTVFRRIASCDSVTDAINSVHFEKGYVLYNYLLSCISNDYRILLVTTSLIVFYSYGRFFYKNSKSPWLSAYLFFAIMQFDFVLSAQRQALAIAILLYSFEYIKERKPIRFIFLCLLAMSFHTSACIFLASYPISRYKRNALFPYVTLLASAALTAFWNPILSVLLAVFPQYNYYIGDSYLSSEGILGIICKMAVYIAIVVGPTILGKAQRLSEKTEEEMLLFRMMIFLIALCLPAMRASGLSRVLRYFEPIAMVYLPNELSRKANRDKLLMNVVVVVCFAVYAWVIQEFRTPEWQTTYPFKFFWQ